MKKKFGKISLVFILTFLIAALTVTIAVIAASYTDEAGEITWSYTPNTADMTATITGVTLTKQTKEFNIPSTVSDGNNTYTVTAIGNNAFKDKKMVFGQVTIPDTVKSIGSSAFANTYIFGTVVIPESVTSIGSSAFYNCDGLIEVVLPSGVTVLESNTFEGCYGLTKVNTENIVTFKSKCFSDCQALNVVSFGENAKTIESQAFYRCHSIGGTIDNSMLTSISDNAFQECINIEGVILPNQNIKFGAYNGCTGIQGYYTTDNNISYRSIDGVLYSKDGTTLLKYPTTKSDTTYTVADGATTIAKNAFSGTTYLEEIYIGKDVTTLAEEAFANASIKFAYIPDNVTSVGFYLFKNCTSLETVVFGHGVNVIGLGTFQGATKLKDVFAKNDMVSPVASSATFHYASEYACVDHVYGYDDKAPTCYESGYNRCIYCDRYAFVKATNHSGAILEDVKVSCTSDGYRVIDCIVCNEVVTVVTEKSPGHISNGMVQYVPAQFNAPEFKYSTCSVCDRLYVFDYKADFHILGDVNCDGKVNVFDLSTLQDYLDDNSSVSNISTKNADIVSDDVVDAKDLNYLCGYITGKITELPIKDYTCSYHGNKTTLVIQTVSCENDGFRIIYCKNCGLLDQEIVDTKRAHKLTDTTIINSSCSVEGQRISTCTSCNKKVYETIEKSEHTGVWYTINGQRGYEYTSCSSCGNIASRVVDYSTFDTLIKQIPKYYDVYYQPETINMITPVLANYELSLTRAEVEENVRMLSDALANAQYKTYDTPTIFLQEVSTSQSMGYVSTVIIVVSPDENGKTKVEAIEYNGQVKVRGRGSAGWSAKFPFNIKFSSKVDLFDMGASKKYCLLSNYNDSTLIRNAVMFELSELLGIENSCKYKIVDLYAKGIYYGSYMLTTASDTIGEDRVDIDEDNDFLLEIEKQHEDKDLATSFNFVSPIYGIKFLVNSPEKADMSPEALSSLKSSIAKIDFAIMSGDWELVQQYIDVDSVARYFILHDMLKEIDIVWDSTRFYIKDGKLYGGPGWDFDYSMFWGEIHGGTAFSEQAYYKNVDSSHLCEGGQIGKYYTGVWASVTWLCPGETSTDDKIWFCSLYKHSPEFVTLVCEYVAELHDEISLLYEDQVDENGVVIRENILDSITRNEENRNSFKHNCDASKDRYNKNMYSFDSNVEKLRDWLKNRNEWMQQFYAEKINNPEYSK